MLRLNYSRISILYKKKKYIYIYILFLFVIKKKNDKYYSHHNMIVNENFTTYGFLIPCATFLL